MRNLWQLQQVEAAAVRDKTVTAGHRDDTRPDGDRCRWILALVFLANLLNVYYRAIPAIVVEPLKAVFSLSTRRSACSAPLPPSCAR